MYVGADDQPHDLTGITLNNMFFSGGGGECVRMRNNAHDNAITDSVIQYCGLYGKGSGKKRACTTTARASTSARARTPTTSRCTPTTGARATSSPAT